MGVLGGEGRERGYQGQAALPAFGSLKLAHWHSKFSLTLPINLVYCNLATPVEKLEQVTRRSEHQRYGSELVRRTAHKKSFTTFVTFRRNCVSGGIAPAAKKKKTPAGSHEDGKMRRG